MLKTVAFLLLLIIQLSGQEKLTLEQAVGIGLENNYAIKIAANQSEIAANNATPGNAGMLPTLDASGLRSYSTNTTKQVYASGEVIDKAGVKSNNLNAGVALNWTIFDGLNMFAAYGRLRELKDLGELGSKAAIEQNISLIMSAYYNIVTIDATIQAIKEALAVSEDRVRIAEDKFKIGSGSKIELLQAQVDYNTDKSALLQEQIALSSAKINLNNLIGRPENTVFNVVDSIAVSRDLPYEVLKENTLKNNKDIRIAEKNRSVAEFNLSSAKSLWFPTIGAYANYNFTKSQNEVGFFRTNQNTGLTYGLNFSFNLFNGLNTLNQVQNAGIEVKISSLQEQQIRQEVLAGFEQQYVNYSNGIELINLEVDNVDVARQNVEIALDRYKYGQYTPLELREAQTALLNAQSRLSSANYKAKQAEIELRRLSGQIISTK